MIGTLMAEGMPILRATLVATLLLNGNMDAVPGHLVPTAMRSGRRWRRNGMLIQRSIPTCPAWTGSLPRGPARAAPERPHT